MQDWKLKLSYKQQQQLSLIQNPYIFLLGIANSQINPKLLLIIDKTMIDSKINQIVECLIQVDQNKIKQFPHNCIGILKFTNQGNDIQFGTGFLIQNDLVVTSAHNFNIRKRYEKLQFFPGHSGIIKVGIAVCKFRLSDEYFQADFRTNEIQQQNANKQYLTKLSHLDFALLKLQKPVLLNKYLEVISKPVQNIKQISIFGYPKTKFELVNQNNQQVQAKQCGNVGKIDKLGQGMLYYKMETFKGQSGSPIMANFNNKISVIGIHKGQSNYLIKNIPLNYCLLMTDDIIRLLQLWKQQLNQQKISNKQQQSNRNYLASSINIFQWKILNSQMKSLLIKDKIIEGQYIQNQGSNQIIAKIQHKKDSNIRITIKIHQCKGKNNLFMGILSQDSLRLMQKGIVNSFAAGLWNVPSLKKGRILINGQEKLEMIKDLFISSGGSLTFLINKQHNQMSLLINSKNIKLTFKLPYSYEQAGLYLYVVMENPKDKIQIVDQ